MAFNPESKMYGQGTDAQMLNSLGVFGIVDSAQRDSIIKDTVASINEAYKQLHQIQLGYIQEEYTLRSRLEGQFRSSQKDFFQETKDFHSDLFKTRMNNEKSFYEQKRKYDAKLGEDSYQVSRRNLNLLKQEQKSYLDAIYSDRSAELQKEFNEFTKQSIIDSTKEATQYINSLPEEFRKKLGESGINEFFDEVVDRMNQRNLENWKKIKDEEEEAQQKIAEKQKQTAQQISNILLNAFNSVLSYGGSYFGLNSFGTYSIKGALDQGNQAAYDTRKSFGAWGMDTFKQIGESMVEAQKSLQERGLAVGPQQMNQTITRLDKSYALALRSKEDLAAILEHAAAIEEGVTDMNLNSENAKWMERFMGSDSWVVQQDVFNAISQVFKQQGVSIDAQVLNNLINDSAEGMALNRQLIAASGGDSQKYGQYMAELANSIGKAISKEGNLDSTYEMILEAFNAMSLNDFGKGTVYQSFATGATYGMQFGADKFDKAINTIINSRTDIAGKFGGNYSLAELFDGGSLGSAAALQGAGLSAGNVMAAGIGNMSLTELLTYKDVSAKNTEADKATAKTSLESFENSLQAAGGPLENISVIRDTVTEIKNALGLNTIINGITNTFGNKIGEGITKKLIPKLSTYFGKDALGKAVTSGTGKALQAGGLSMASGAGSATGLSGILSKVGAALPYVGTVAAILGTTYAVTKSIQEDTEGRNKALESGLPGFFEANGMSISVNGVTGMPVITYESEADKNGTGNTFTQYGYDISSGELSRQNVEVADEAELKQRQKASAAALYTSMKDDTRSGWGKFFGATSPDDIMVANPDSTSSEKYITIDSLYKQLNDGTITYEQFEESIAKARKKVTRSGGGVSTTIYEELSDKNSPLSKERRAELFWEDLSGLEYTGPESAFAELLAIYSSQGLLNKDQSNILNWDNQTINFLQKFFKYYDAYNDSGYNPASNIRHVYDQNDKYKEVAGWPSLTEGAVVPPTEQWYTENVIELGKEYGLLANGISAVPYNGFPAILHQGEMVLPSKKANYIRALFGQKPVPGGGVPESVNTGNNSFVQSLPDYHQSALPLTGGADDSLMSFAAGDDAVAYMKGLASRGVTYGQMDCSDSVSAAYNAAGLGVKLSDNCRDIYRWDKYGFNFLYNAADHNKAKLTKDALNGMNLKRGDVILMDLNSGNDRYPDHVSLVTNPGSMIHSYKSWDTQRGVGGPHESGYWNGAIAVLRYGQGSDGNIGINLNDSKYYVDGGQSSYGNRTTGSLTSFSGSTFSSRDLSFIENPDLLLRLADSNEYIAAVVNMLGLGQSSANTNTGVSGSGNRTLALISKSKGGIVGGLQSSRYRDLLIENANKIGMDPNLLYGIMQTESSGRPNLVTGSYKGLMQIDDGKIDLLYGKGSGVNIFDPDVNIAAAANWLAKKCIPKTGYISLAIGAYNAGQNLQAWQTAKAILDGGGDWNTILKEMQDVGSSQQSMKGNPNAIKTSYIKSVYGYAGVPLEVPYLAKGGIVDSPVLSMIGEGQHPEAVTPLDQDNRLLGLDSMTDSLLDGLDSVCGHLINKMNEIISVIRESGNRQVSFFGTGTNYENSQQTRMARIKNMGVNPR